MSGHLIGCVKDLTGLGKSHKLALVAFADSADDRTHIGFPGYDGIRAWADCSRGRAAELVRDLVEAGYLKPHKKAGPGRRAEYVVFPNGCCDVHRTPAPDEGAPTTAADLIAIARAAGVDLGEHAAQAMAAQMSGQGNGSEIPDQSPRNESETPDPFLTAQAIESEVSDSMPQRVQNGSEISDAYTPTTTSPPSPRKRGATSTTTTTTATASCPKHRDGAGTNCRPCGTTPRQLSQARRAAATIRKREADAAAIAAERAAKANRGNPTPVETSARQAAREAAAAARAAARAADLAGRTR